MSALPMQCIISLKQANIINHTLYRLSTFIYLFSSWISHL